MQTFTTPAAITARVDIAAGDIRLVATDRTDTTVDVRPADPAKSRDTKAAEQVRVHYTDGVLHIETPTPGNRVLGDSGTVEITVRLPFGSHVDARTAAGRLSGVGRLGDVTFEGAAATAELDETAAARLTLQAGDITVNRLHGAAELRTLKGDITVTEAHRGTVTLHTQAGTLTIGAAHGTSATLDATTAFGRITNTLRNSVGADAPLAIRADTAYGDITARSL
ncbi:DUF4097 family beta strand repeat-containing protein [Streptomyces sp. NPDC051180]|uniref:DUF4097 family beta strand repeat-containing protein n=1 Tax=unclassified Streptomyces TaxID=2593676 RepID=UPI00344ED215